jgi:hypothetical protein
VTIIWRLAPLFVLFFACLLQAMKLDRPKPQVPGRDYNIEYRIEWAFEKNNPQIVYEWFWMPDGEYPGR